MDSHRAVPPTLVTLPPELVLRLLDLLDPQAIVRLSSTCKTLSAIGRTESIWRELVLDLVTQNGEPGQSAAPPPPAPPHSTATRTWWAAAAFLLPLSNRLGYHASSRKFSSRIIRVSIRSSPPTIPSLDSPPPYYTLHAAHLRPRNLYDSPNPPHPGAILPFGAFADSNPTSYIISPNINPSHPYAGLSVDVLQPFFDDAAEMFDVTPETGAMLCRPDSGTSGAQTRESVLAAVAAAGIFGGGQQSSSSPSSSSNAFRLRLSLSPAERRVAQSSRPLSRSFGPSGPASSPLSSEDGTSDEEEDFELDGPGRLAGFRLGNAARQREALYAMLAASLPPTPWPTAGLVGLEEVGLEELYGAGGGAGTGSVLRVSTGAFRGACEALTRRGGEGPLVTINPSSDGRRQTAVVAGFRLRAKRTPVPSATKSHATSSSSSNRPSIGRRNSPGVLWQGGVDPEEEEPLFTLLRNGDDGEGPATVFRLPDRTPAPPGAFPLPPSSPPLDASSLPIDSALADAIDSSTESFFPLKPPSRPLSFSSPPSTNEHGDILASSLEGWWLGTYGPHGVECVYLTVGFAEVPLAPSDLRDRPQSRLHRLITATKVTGDSNVPSGQPSWIALLPSPELAAFPSAAGDLTSPSSSSSSSSSDSAALEAVSTLLDGPVPTISRSHFTHLSSLDPFSPLYRALDVESQWSEGAVQGWGRVAQSGYREASWIGAEVRFLREERKVKRGGDPGEGEEEEEEEGEGEDERVIEMVEEIHLKWSEMGKVACFKRVRI